MEKGSGDNEKFQQDLMYRNIQSPDRQIRQSSLQKLLEQCRDEKVTTEEAKEIYDYCYLLIFKCYVDRYESCRILAVDIISALFEKLPSNDFYIENLLPIISKRIGQSEIIEESEEVRLILVEQVLSVIQKSDENDKPSDYKFTKSYNDIIDILTKTLKDPYPAIQRSSCSIVKALAAATHCFSLRAESLINPLFVMLTHRQAANRQAAIEALGVVCLHVKGENIIKIITAISPLLMDSIPLVRMECGRVGCFWLMDLPDRYSFFERILPLVLCCLTDDTIEIRNEIDVLWKKCGEQYFRENETEISPLELVDQMPKNYLKEYTRPTLECRALVQRSLRVVTIVIREMQDWKVEVRLHSLKLLSQVVLHSEKAFTAKFIEIYPVLSKCCADKENEVATEAVITSTILGRLLDYKAWIEYGLNGLKENPTIGVLSCFTGLYKGSDNEKIADLYNVTKILSNPTICHNIIPGFQVVLIALTEILVDLFLNSSQLEKQMEKLQIDGEDSIISLLYEILLNLIALADGDISSVSQSVLLKLAKNNQSELDKFHSKYLKAIIDGLEDLDSENSERSTPVILLCGIITNCGFRTNYLDVLKKAITTTLDNASPKANIKLFSAISVAMLNWNSNMATSMEESKAQLRLFIQDIIEPCLIWKAGRNSESLRSMATAALCGMTQGATEESYDILPELGTHFVTLIDDNISATRLYSLKCLFNCGPVQFMKLKPLALGILARLDDPSTGIRKCAIECISLLKLKVNDEHDVDSWEIVLRHILSILLLHLDDPEIDLRELLLVSIGEIGKNYPTLFVESLANLPKSFPYWKELDEIKLRVLN